MTIDELLHSLFDDVSSIRRQGSMLSGEARLGDRPLAVIGTVDRPHLGARLALDLAREVLDVMRETPGRPILMIVNNSGQKLSLWDELMGNNGFVAHLGKCLDQARRQGHRIVGIVHEQAVSAGFMATGMSTDRCYSLPDAELRLMAASAMSRVTRIPEARLEELFRTSPILGPGVCNFVRIGGLYGLLEGDIRQQVIKAFEAADAEEDARLALGRERGGRMYAAEIAAMVRAGLSG